MSGNGMLIAVPVRLRQETLITVTVTLPVEITRVPFELECQARVVRQIPAGRRVEGIGAIIDDYRFQPAYRPA